MALTRQSHRKGGFICCWIPKESSHGVTRLVLNTLNRMGGPFPHAPGHCHETLDFPPKTRPASASDSIHLTLPRFSPWILNTLSWLQIVTAHIRVRTSVSTSSPTCHTLPADTFHISTTLKGQGVQENGCQLQSRTDTEKFFRSKTFNKEYI